MGTQGPTPAPHTPMSLVLAGGFDMSDEACKKALAACGLDADEAGNHASVLDAQRDARSDLQQAARERANPSTPAADRPHLAPCRRPPDSAPSTGRRPPCRCHESAEARQVATPQEFLMANSQSGHLGRDQLMRNGTRAGEGDPCQNYPPSGSGDCGTYGYSTTGAPCMPHYGRSNLRGSPHELICREEEAHQRAMRDAGVNPGDRLTQAQIEDGVRRTATTAATGSRWEYDANGNPVRRIQEADATRQANQRQYQTDQTAAAANLSGDASGAGPGSNSAAGSDQLTNDQKHAIECIVNKWKKSIAALQNEAVQNHGPGNASSQEAAAQALAAEGNAYRPWDQLSPADQRRAVEARQRELAAQGAGGMPGPSADAAAADRCREYQANHLWLNGSGTPPNMTFPPVSGAMPGGNIPAPTTTSTTTTTML